MTTRFNPRTSVGEVYGRLTVTDPGPYYENTTRRQKRLVARCECGDERRYDEYRVVSGTATQCPPCAYKQRGKSVSVPDSGWNLWYYNYKCNATTRGLSFDLSMQEFKDICSLPCHYCGAAPVERKQRRHSPVVANGIDRLDSSVGYLTKNCVASCTHCNRMKGAMSPEEFLSHIDSIYKFGLKR